MYVVGNEKGATGSLVEVCRVDRGISVAIVGWLEHVQK